MKHQYESVPRFTNLYIANMADRICPVEIMEAHAFDALEPATHKAWRHIRNMHSAIRSAVYDLRSARSSLGKYTRMPMPWGGFESRKSTQADIDNSAARLRRLIAAKADAWAILRHAEQDAG